MTVDVRPVSRVRISDQVFNQLKGLIYRGSLLRVADEGDVETGGAAPGVGGVRDLRESHDAALPPAPWSADTRLHVPGRGH